MTLFAWVSGCLHFVFNSYSLYSLDSQTFETQLVLLTANSLSVIMHINSSNSISLVPSR